MSTGTISPPTENNGAIATLTQMAVMPSEGSRPKTAKRPPRPKCTWTLTVHGKCDTCGCALGGNCTICDTCSKRQAQIQYARRTVLVKHGTDMMERNQRLRNCICKQYPYTHVDTNDEYYLLEDGLNILCEAMCIKRLDLLMYIWRLSQTHKRMVIK